MRLTWGPELQASAWPPGVDGYEGIAEQPLVDQVIWAAGADQDAWAGDGDQARVTRPVCLPAAGVNAARLPSPLLWGATACGIG